MVKNNVLEQITKMQINNEELRNFDPKASYPAYDEMTELSIKMRHAKIGGAFNLIKDMLKKGACVEELTRAIKYFMVVMDLVKNSINYKQAYIDYEIRNLYKKYRE
ncbi:MAG: hypothetical protein K0S61_94 [Anaerocolumna sp.]|nr:hypothetical protein [Anaerocolumna sp.]